MPEHFAKWKPFLPDSFPADLVPLFDKLAEHAATGNTDLTTRVFWRVIKSVLHSPYLVTGYQPEAKGQPFWVSVWKEDAAKENHHIFTTYQQGCPNLQALCQWFLSELL